jgi:hypothetical protein
MTPFTFDLDMFSLQRECGRAVVELRGGEPGFRMAGLAHPAAGPAGELTTMDIGVTVGALSELLDGESARGRRSLHARG